LIDLLIFDNDGTLVDSEFLCQVAMARELAVAGHAADPDALSEEFRGWELARTLEVLGRRLDTRFDADFVERYRRRMFEMLETELEAMPGAGPALEELAGLDLARCVASGGPRRKIETALATTGLRRHFGDHLYSSYDIDSFKPEPGLFLHVAERFRVTPARCLVIEDSAVGLEAARRAGMPVVHVAPDARDAEGVHGIGSLTELPQLVRRLLG
jgi:HAD superfamily hydrolase (TIGR01509 family)